MCFLNYEVPDSPGGTDARVPAAPPSPGSGDNLTAFQPRTLPAFVWTRHVMSQPRGSYTCLRWSSLLLSIIKSLVSSSSSTIDQPKSDPLRLLPQHTRNIGHSLEMHFHHPRLHVDSSVRKQPLGQVIWYWRAGVYTSSSYTSLRPRQTTHLGHT
jgi:hypothetical protein